MLTSKFKYKLTKDQEIDLRSIENDTIENDAYRRVLFTGKNMQLAVMSLKAGEEIGQEVHENDQFFRVEKGKGIVRIVGQEDKVISDGTSILIGAGIGHNIINTGNDELKLYTLYAPPHHPKNLIQLKKEA